jgi:hypothetical protein
MCFDLLTYGNWYGERAGFFFFFFFFFLVHSFMMKVTPHIALFFNNFTLSRTRTRTSINRVRSTTQCPGRPYIGPTSSQSPDSLISRDVTTPRRLLTLTDGFTGPDTLDTPTSATVVAVHVSCILTRSRIPLQGRRRQVRSRRWESLRG